MWETHVMRLYIKKQNSSLRVATPENPEKVAVMYKIDFSAGAQGRVSDSSGYRPCG
ncbi:hypothetical protein ABIC74_003595 [Mucilaginibacter rubeus]